MIDVDLWVPPRKMWGSWWWTRCPVNNVDIYGDPEWLAKKVWRIAKATGIPMLRLHAMLRVTQFGPKGFDLEWSPTKELKAIRERAAEDASLLALGDALPFEELIAVWLRSREGLRLSIALGQADHETKVAHHQGERQAEIIRMKAGELLKRHPGEEAESDCHTLASAHCWPRFRRPNIAGTSAIAKSVSANGC
jgi:hypothetical protein